jgi:hypothetical protein
MKLPQFFYSKTFFIFLIPVSLVILYAVINFEYMFQGKSVILLDLMDKFGYDFRDFHWAGRFFLKGTDPWQWERFVTPPLSLYIILPFSFMSAKLAVQIFFFVNFLCLLCGAHLYNSVFAIKGNPVRWSGIVLLTTILFSYPVYFLLHRGNIDGIVFLFLALSIFFASRPKGTANDMLASLFLALACHVKIYPILMIIPLIMVRRWRLFFFFIFWLACFAFLTFGMWGSFFDKMLVRESVFRTTENGSIVNLIFVVVSLLNYFLIKSAVLYNFIVIKWIAYVVYATCLGLNIYVDLKNKVWENEADFARVAVMYTPFIVSLPDTVFHYEYIHLLAFVPFLLWGGYKTEKTGLLTYILAFGLILSQIHAGALYFLTENVLTYYFPGIGVMLIVVSCLGIKIRYGSLFPSRERKQLDGQ